MWVSLGWFELLNVSNSFAYHYTAFIAIDVWDDLRNIIGLWAHINNLQVTIDIVSYFKLGYSEKITFPLDIMNKSLSLSIETRTPIWTAGVDGKVDRIHKMGLIGNLRWWYELRRLGC